MVNDIIKMMKDINPQIPYIFWNLVREIKREFQLSLSLEDWWKTEEGKVLTAVWNKK